MQRSATSFNNLSRWKYEWPAAEQMDMDVKDRLAAVGICVDDDTIAVVGKAATAGDLSRSQKQMAEHRRIFFRGLIERIDMIARYDQDVRRGLWGNVVKGKAHIVLIHPGRRYLARNYLAKQAISRSHNEYNN